MKNLSFHINNWEHLYSLQQAVSYNAQNTGQQLSIKGRIVNQAFLHNIDTNVVIHFLQTDDIPDYITTSQGIITLGLMSYTKQALKSEIKVDRKIFDELRKNLLEYADIEGIHIIVTLGLNSDATHWAEGESLDVIELNYAMKGDA